MIIKNNRRIIVAALIVVLLSALPLAWFGESEVAAASKGAAVDVYVLDVGEALAVLIDDKNTEILIDGGNDRDGDKVASFVKKYVTDGKLEYVIATHSHADHIGGLDKVYKAFKVKHTIYGDKGTSIQFKEFWNAAKNEPGSDVAGDSNKTIKLPGGAKLKILDIIDGESNTNNNSVISVLDTGKRKVLITGDAEDEKSAKVHTALIAALKKSKVSKVDVFVVGHHGSETSNSEELLAQIKPTYALISSAGPAYSYKNPDISVVTRLTAARSKIYGTYRSGDIKVKLSDSKVSLSSTSKERLTVKNFKAS